MSRVIVGLSGGVDSAVSAALLQRDGHEVTGAFIKIWQPEFIECTWREDRLDAMRVCAALNIPYKEVDLSDEYRHSVVDRMVAAYDRGETPNPDVLCNSEIKFGVFLEWALRSGAACIATGHYAQIDAGHLFRGIDPAKDQSYFLHRIAEEHLRRTIFPVGGLEKRAVRALAEKFALPVATKHDSQGLCFVGDITLPEFLGRYLQLERGVVRDISGKAIGYHDGALLYTKGQRHGFTLEHDSDHELPRYVCATDRVTNEIVVSASKSDAESTVAYVEDIRWINAEPKLPRVYDTQTRYREGSESAVIEKTATGICARFTKPHILSPGQSLVVYDGSRCLGGGPISRVA